MLTLRRMVGLTLCVTLIAGAFWGCDRSPVSFDQADAPVATKKVKRSSAQRILITEQSALYLQSASGNFSSDGGKLSVVFPQYTADSDIQVQSVEFVVAKGALQADTHITMDVYSGTSIEDIRVVFGPSGTEFVPSAVLNLKLSGNVKPEDLVAYHYSADQVTDAVIEKESGWKVIIDVPGFSRYSLGGDR